MSKQTKNIPKLRFPQFANEKGWEVKKLGEAATFVNEKTPLKNLSINSYISTENILSDFAGVTSASRLPTSGNFTKYRKGDVLISNIRPYLKKVWFSDKEGAGSNDVFVIRTKSDLQDLFLSFLLKNDNFINYVMVGAKGVKMPRGDKDLISKYPISFPSKTEQQKIASCLSSLDEVITAESQKLEVLKEHKKGLLQKLLHQEIRFKREDGNSFSDWKEVNFTDCCELAHGFQFREDHFTEKGIPIIKIGSLIDNGCLSFKNATYVDEKYKDEFLKFKLKKGDILMALTGGTLGKVSKISKDYGLIFQNYRVGKFEPKQNAIKDYILCSSIHFGSRQS